MTVRYVGPGGNNANSGLSWALRKLTLNGVEDTPVSAGDVVYVGPGTYREALTVDVSGTAGAGVIQFIGDYTGANTDGVGGVVRITGSDNDQTVTRTTCISASSKNYRKFEGFLCDLASTAAIYLPSATNITINKCAVGALNSAGPNGIYCTGAGQLANTITNCYLAVNAGNIGIYLEHSSAVSDATHVINNCIFTGYGQVFRSDRVGGVVIKNSTFSLFGGAIRAISLAAGQTVVVNNCIFTGGNNALQASTLGEIVEDYNAIFGVSTPRTNVATGANSNAFPALFDARWFFEAVNGGDMVTPFDLASYSQLVNVAGTSPTATDLRGTAVQGAQREWGALEYAPALLIEAGSGGGGAVSISPFRGNF